MHCERCFTFKRHLTAAFFSHMWRLIFELGFTYLSCSLGLAEHEQICVMMTFTCFSQEKKKKWNKKDCANEAKPPLEGLGAFLKCIKLNLRPKTQMQSKTFKKIDPLSWHTYLLQNKAFAGFPEFPPGPFKACTTWLKTYLRLCV